ncbi:hypothetical protein DFH28DRAFT_931005 [Melampsora americana]|nr:hypothetical protein DFH28DRAFT_931005 [Melampsora americana]
MPGCRCSNCDLESALGFSHAQLDISTSTFDLWIQKKYTLLCDPATLFNRTILALCEPPLKIPSVSEGDPICRDIRYIRLCLQLRKAFRVIFEHYYPDPDLSYFTPEDLFSLELSWKLCKNVIALTDGLTLDAICGGEPLPKTYVKLTEVMITPGDRAEIFGLF